MSSRSLTDLHPRVHQMANAMLAACDREGIDLLVACTLRPADEQERLYAWGRGGDKRQILTNAKPGHSYHQYGLALDVVPMVNGKPEWSAHAKVWTDVGRIGESVGFEWAGRWETMRELPHFQWTGGLSIEDLLAGKQPPEDAA